MLTIVGKPKESSQRGWIGSAFESNFRISDSYDLEGVTAHLANGVLTIAVPKAEKAKPRRIAVTAQPAQKQIEAQQ